MDKDKIVLSRGKRDVSSSASSMSWSDALDLTQEHVINRRRVDPKMINNGEHWTSGIFTVVARLDDFLEEERGQTYEDVKGGFMTDTGRSWRFVRKTSITTNSLQKNPSALNTAKGNTV